MWDPTLPRKVYPKRRKPGISSIPPYFLPRVTATVLRVEQLNYDGDYTPEETKPALGLMRGLPFTQVASRGERRG